MALRSASIAFGLLAPLLAQSPIAKADPASLVHALADPTTRSRAARDLVELGEPAVAPLAAALAKPELRAPALAVLARIGRPAVSVWPQLLDLATTCPPQEVPALLRTVADLAPLGGVTAQEIFAKLGAAVVSAQQQAKDAELPELRRQVRWEWKRTIERCSLSADAPLAELIAALGRDDGFARETAAYLLGQRGAAAETAIPALLDALVATHPDVVYWPETTDLGESVPYTSAIHASAAEALVRIAPAAAAVVPAHALRVESPDPETRRVSLAALGAAGAASLVHRDAVVARLGDPEATVVREAITALLRIGELDEPTRARIAALAEHTDAQVRATVKAALRTGRQSK